MTTVEIILLIVGIVFMIASFFVTERLSQKEVTQLAEVSSTAVKRILEKNMQQTKVDVAEQIQNVVGRSLEDARRSMERESNLKIQNISEYSVTVLEDIQKNHSEVMFLYSMLNDKQVELNNIVGSLGALKTEMEQLEEDVTVMIAENVGNIRAWSLREPEPENSPRSKDDLMDLSDYDVPMGIDDFELPEVGSVNLDQELSHIGNQNRDILELYRQKMDPKEIARQLGMGVGEVKLVIDLYREGEA